MFKSPTRTFLGWVDDPAAGFPASGGFFLTGPPIGGMKKIVKSEESA
jgi:hypothetical protein